MEMGPFPNIQPQNREQWINCCREFFQKFQTLREFGVVVWAHLAYIYDKSGFPAGCCIVFQDNNGDWYAGGSYVDARDRHRYSKHEARARALAGRQKLYVKDDFTKPADQIPWLSHFPPSCRGKIHSMMLGRPSGETDKETGVVDERPVKAD